MRFISETSDAKQPVLIVDATETRSAVQIENKLRQNDDIDILKQKKFPGRPEHFYLIVAINPEWDDEWRYSVGKKSRIVLIYIKQLRKAQVVANRIDRDEIKNIKVVSVNTDFLDDAALEKVLWMAFTASNKQVFLELTVHRKVGTRDPLADKNIRKQRRFKRHYIIGGILTLAAYSLITVLILLAASLLYVRSFAVSVNDEEHVGPSHAARGMNIVGRALYRPIRPILFFFSLGLLPDTLVDMNTQLEALSQTYNKIEALTISISRNIFIKQKNAPLKEALSRQISDLNGEVTKGIELSTLLEQKIPHWNAQTESVRLAISSHKDVLSRLQPVPTLLESILAKNSRNKYLVLFADTNSAKPGGGVLPFFGVLMMSDLDIDSFELYDSRSVDQARSEPIETSEAYRSVTGESEYTLQNALLAADFSENYRQIAQVLNREANMRNFDGAFLLTDRGLAKIVSAYSPVYVPQLKETISPENLMIKYQIAPDKKVFITALMSELQRRAAATQSQSLVPALLEAFNEKQIVFLSDEEKTAKAFDDLYWSGSVPTPRCFIPSFVCTVDYVFPLQSNLGTNPVNRFIEKSMVHRISIDAAGKISNSFSMNLRNSSLSEIFPGGTYTSYAQIILPAAADVKRVSINGMPVTNPTVITSTYTIIGFSFELAAQTSKEIKVEYELKDTLPKSKSIYQLMFQKQIGSSNSEIAFEITLPTGATITNKNFSPVVKNGRVSYNTVLNADKVFVLEIDNSNL